MEQGCSLIFFGLANKKHERERKSERLRCGMNFVVPMRCETNDECEQFFYTKTQRQRQTDL